MPVQREGRADLACNEYGAVIATIPAAEAEPMLGLHRRLEVLENFVISEPIVLLDERFMKATSCVPGPFRFRNRFRSGPCREVNEPELWHSMALRMPWDRRW